MDSFITEASEESVDGVYTRTIIRSPVIRWILHAQVRYRDFKDVVFVGEDFIHVKQLVDGAHLQHIATKCDFDSRIRAAAAFSNWSISGSYDTFIKSETDAGSMESKQMPPQSIVLTLESNDLLFLYLLEEPNGTPKFVQQNYPMPSFDRILFQPGEHLAVEPRSRALAVSANEREVILYATKQDEGVKVGSPPQGDCWCLVSSQRPLLVDGVIQHMNFLVPPEGDEDHAILLLIVVDCRKSRAIWIDWYHSSGLHNVQIHPPQSLDRGNCVSSLLVPLLNASFLLVTGQEIKHWKDILSGSATGITISTLDLLPQYPGSSPGLPLWANWAKPRRSREALRERDHVYLAREDGLVFLVLVSSSSVKASLAGDLECHVGTAFASLGGDQDPDILVAGGDMSAGRVVSIGSWPTSGSGEDVTWREAMTMERTESIPNWASVTDFVSTDFGSIISKRSGDSPSLYVTSGRQPYGCITELRQGLEARLSVYLPLDDLRSTLNVWALRDTLSSAVVIIMSNPSATQLLMVSSEDDTVEDLEESSSFNIAETTLAAGTTASGHIVQVAPTGICASSSLFETHESPAKQCYEHGSIILAAAIVSEHSAIITARKRDESYDVVCNNLILSQTDDVVSRTSIELGPSTELGCEPICMAAIAVGSSIVTVISMANKTIVLLRYTDGQSDPSYKSHALVPELKDRLTICDNITLLQVSTQSENTSDFLVVCGLRDGKIVTYRLDLSNDNPFMSSHITDFGHSTVKLVRTDTGKSSALAISGPKTCLIDWNGNQPFLTSIQNIWISDRQRPELAQSSVIACASIASATSQSSDSFAVTLVLVSDEEILLAELDRTITVVPRQISVSGTPNRLIYSEQQRCFICSSLCTEVRSMPSLPSSSSRPHVTSERKRRIWPAIDFIPAKKSAPTFTYKMQPGERVYSILEWSYRNHEDKMYSYILVGGSYVRQSGHRRGRIIFLQPQNRRWEVVGVSGDVQSMLFQHEVYALAQYDNVTFVACAGESVFLYRFSIEEKKWHEVCPSLKLASPGVFVSTHLDSQGTPLITVSTARDSVVTIKLEYEIDEERPTRNHNLVPVIIGPRADNSLSHLQLSGRVFEIDPFEGLTLCSTKQNQLIGLTRHVIPSKPPCDRSAWRTSEVIFEASLPRSLTRICRTRAMIGKGAPPLGIVDDRILGSTSDGSVVGIALLQNSIWRRLCWLQRLCEWSEELCPASHSNPPYRASGENSTGHRDRALPIGLQNQGDAIVLHASSNRHSDMHIDGDIVSRILSKRGSEALKDVIRQLADKRDIIGSWIRGHLDQELEAVDEMVEVVRRLEEWL